jgi:hypothetical protein
VPAREGRQSLQAHVDELLKLPFVDVLYIRCDWRDVQSAPGKLNLSPIWQVAIQAAQKHGKRLAFRIQSSNTVGQPQRLALPDFLREKIPYHHSKDGAWRKDNPEGFHEPMYDHPAFGDALVELSELLAERFDGEPWMEFVDLMMYGFWGEGHTNDYPNPIPYQISEKVFLHLTEAQRRIWVKTPLAVNIQADISRAGNRAVHELAMRAGMYLRCDSIMENEPIVGEQLAHRPPHVPVILEDGYYRLYDQNAPWFKKDENGVNVIENMILHALDLGGSYFCLWTEGLNLQDYYKSYPVGFNTLQARLGYRVRPSWIYQRKRYGANELVVVFHNDGVASVAGHLRLTVSSAAGQVLAQGLLDAGHPYAGKTRSAAFLLPEAYNTGGEVYLSAALVDQKGTRPVRFACEQKMGEKGYRIDLAPMDAPDWRKDI